LQSALYKTLPRLTDSLPHIFVDGVLIFSKCSW
jgi:hypothetical protein